MHRNKYGELISKIELKEISNLINAISVPYAIIKGEPLSFLAYNGFALRKKSDIDILVDRRNVRTVELLLAEYGFIPQNNNRNNRILFSNSHQTSPWIKKVNHYNIQIVIDINFDIFWGEYTGKRINIDEFLNDTIELNIYGFRIKTLPPIKALIQLILHQYKDMNSLFLLATRNSIKYGMFNDLYYLFKNNMNNINLDNLYTMSLEYGIIPYVYYMLYYMGVLFDDETLRNYIVAFKTNEGEELLNCYGLNASERHRWKVDFQTRLESENLYNLIKEDLSEKDIKKININRKVFFNE